MDAQTRSERRRDWSYVRPYSRWCVKTVGNVRQSAAASSWFLGWLN